MFFKIYNIYILNFMRYIINLKILYESVNTLLYEINYCYIINHFYIFS